MVKVTISALADIDSKPAIPIIARKRIKRDIRKERDCLCMQYSRKDLLIVWCVSKNPKVTSVLKTGRISSIKNNRQMNPLQKLSTPDGAFAPSGTLWLTHAIHPVRTFGTGLQTPSRSAVPPCRLDSPPCVLNTGNPFRYDAVTQRVGYIPICRTGHSPRSDRLALTRDSPQDEPSGRVHTPVPRTLLLGG